MSTYKVFLVQKHIKEWLLVVVLCVALVLAIIVAVNKKSETILIAIDQSGTRLITENEDPIYKQELLNFISAYVQLGFNFDQTNLKQKAELYTEWFTIELFKEKESSIRAAILAIEKEPMQSSAQIYKISKERNDSGQETYKVKLKQSINRRFKVDEYDYNLYFKMKKLEKRSKQNPWGYEITELRQEQIFEETK